MEKDPMEVTQGRKLGERLLRQCDRENFGPFAAMFAGQVILTKCAEVARRAGNATAWNTWLDQAISILRLPEASY